MLRRGRGRPRKQVACSVTSSWKVHLKTVGKGLIGKQSRRRRQRILELATANLCSAITGRNSSIRDLKHFARQLGKRTVHPVYSFCPQRASGVDLNSPQTRDIAVGTANLEDILGSKQGKSHFDTHVDQWVGVEVLLFGRKSSIGEVGSTTSNVCENLRSVVADSEREHLCASFAKRRGEQEDREWPSAEKDGVVPSWVSCRRSITRVNASGGISDCHIAALLASLPELGHIDVQARTTNNVFVTEGNGAGESAVIPVDRPSAAVVTLDQSSAAAVPMAQSYASQESIVNSRRGSSLDVGQMKRLNGFVLQRDAIQVCPTTPEKAQKRRRSYQDIIPDHDDRGTDACEPSNRTVPIGGLDLRLPGCEINIKEPGGHSHILDILARANALDFEGDRRSTGIGERGLTRSLVDFIPTTAIANPSIIVDPVQERSPLFQANVPSAPDLVMEAADNNGKEPGGRLLLTDSLSPYSVEFESSCNSTKGPNVAVGDCARSLVDSLPTPAVADPLFHMACVLADPLQENSQLTQTPLPSASVLVVEAKKRKEKRGRPRIIKDSGDIVLAPKVRKKYKPRVAKVKPTETPELQKKTRVSKHARTENFQGNITGGAQWDTLARIGCNAPKNLEYTGTIVEDRNSCHQEEIMGSRIGVMPSESFTSVSPGEPPSTHYTSLARSIIDGYLPRPHLHGPFNLGPDNTVSDCLVCGTCGLKQKAASAGSETGHIEQTNNSFEDQMVSEPFLNRDKHFEALSVAISNRVFALLDLPSIGKSHSMYLNAGEVEQSPPIQSSDVYEGTALPEYGQATAENGFPSFMDDWTASHRGSAEMTALNTYKDAAEVRFDMFSKEQQFAVPENALFETLAAEINECFSAISDTWVRESPCEEGHRGILSNSHCGLDEFVDRSFVPQNSCPSSVQESFLAQMMSPLSEEERITSSFYASTSAGVNSSMLSQLNEIIEESVENDASRNENGDMDMNAGQDLNMDVKSEQVLNINVNADQDLKPDCGQIEASSTCPRQRTAEEFKEVGLLGDYCCEEEDLMRMRDTVLYQMRSQFLHSALDSAPATESLPAKDNPEATRNSVPCLLSLQCQDVDPVSNIAAESAIVQAEVSNGLKVCNLTLKQTTSRKDTGSAETPFHLMTFDQLVAYYKTNLINSSKMSPLKLLCHIQAHLPEDERDGFEKLWPMLLHPVNCKQLQELIDLAELDLPSFTEAIQDRQVKVKAKENNPVASCMEVIQYQLKERRDDGDNRVTDMVPFVNHAVVPYEGPFLLRKRKPRAKVDLDMESIRVWKLLMGKTEAIEGTPDVDTELKWKEERLIMKKQADEFIQRMHLIQGDRSFSRWKGSIVDSVIGVFLTQNVSDVLSSSAYMSLRSRFPLRRGHVPCKSPEGDAEAVLQVHPESSQTCEESQTRGFDDVMFKGAPAILEAASGEETLTTQEGIFEKNIESNLEIGQVGDNQIPLTLKRQQKKSVSYTQLSATDTLLNEIAGALELNIFGNKNVKSDVENRNEDQGPMTLSKEIVLSSIENPLPLSTSIRIQKEVLTGIERARLEAVQVTARKSSKWNAVAESYNAKCKQAAMDAAALPGTAAAEDGVDWEAIRCADLEEIADAIKERGMNWKLAGRIKGFLERLRLEQGAIDLEWLRSIPSDDAKEFLTSIHGLGLKSVECIRLLSLHHLAFPVDTNVGRICVRLGWVPLEPLPEELQLHILELYPVQTTIQKYLWPRLCTLDQQTLYELHYQLITFGKVFCTKSKPNCNACPMRSDCKHFASALASAKLALLPPETVPSSNVTLALPPGSNEIPEAAGEEGALSSAKAAQPSMCISQYCQPIIEEPMTPESEADMSEFDIEDYPFSVEEIAHETMMDLFIQEIQGRQEVHHPDRSYKSNISESETVQEMDVVELETPAHVPEVVKSEHMMVDCKEELKNGLTNPTQAISLFIDEPSKEVVLLSPEAAFLPVPKLKNIERLRTVHYVYELPDSHPLLEGMDVREADDPCYYLLAIWSPGEVPESIPNINDDNEEIGFQSFGDEESIKATLLVPCRTAMQGRFPLNGTYFQTNEVFADHASSLQPILVPRVLLWNLRRRFVYFGTSVTSIMRGMTTEEIQACFWRGYVCVRGFDRETRAPKPLVHRLHFQAAKSVVRSASVKNIKT